MDEIDAEIKNNKADQEPEQKKKKSRKYQTRKFRISRTFYFRIYKVFKHKFSHFRGSLLPGKWGSRRTWKKEKEWLDSADRIQNTLKNVFESNFEFLDEVEISVLSGDKKLFLKKI